MSDALRPTRVSLERGPATVTRLGLAVCVCVLMMTVDHRAGGLESVRKLVSALVYPLQYAVDLPIRGTSWLLETTRSRRQLAENNRELRDERFRLLTRLQRFEELEAENRRLRHMLETSAKVTPKVLVAELLSVDMNPFSRQIVLDKGARHGVVRGQSLIDSQGIMGQVIHVSPFSSNALLITDPNHALPVQLNRNGLRAVAVGTGSLNLLELKHMPNNADIGVGDLLVTSGLGGRFPAGYPVGRVSSVRRDSAQPFARIMVEPSAHLERNREVLLVWPNELAPGEFPGKLRSPAEQGGEDGDANHDPASENGVDAAVGRQSPKPGEGAQAPDVHREL